MKINKNTRHYRRFEYWRDRTAAGRKYREHQELVFDEDGWPVRDELGYVYKTVPGKPVSLCKYFWVVTLRAPAKMARGWFYDNPVAATVVCVTLGVVVLVTLGLLSPTQWWLPLFVVAMTAVAIAVTFGIIGTIFWVHDQLNDRGMETNIVKAAQNSLLGEFIKSKKHKVCPLLEFED